MRLTRWLRSCHIAVAILGVLLCVGRAPAAESGTDKRPMLRVPVTDSKPVVDGKLEEPCWKNAVKTGPLKVTRGKPSKSTTEAFILRDAEHLYVGVRCAGEATVRQNARRGKRAPGGEYVELAIDSNADGNSYYLVRIVPVRGAIASSYNEDTPPWSDRTWKPSFNSAVAKDAGKWSAEFALPLNIFNKNKSLASEIGFNIVRAGVPGQEPQCWHGRPARPKDWGRLTGFPARAKLPQPDYSTAGLSRFYHAPNKTRRSFLAEEQTRTISLGPGSAHAGTTGEVRLELEGFLLEGDPHARGIIWDLAVNERKGELYVLADTRPVRGVAEVRVFDRRGRYVRTIMPLNPTLPRSSVQDLCRKTAREGGTELIIPKLFLPWGEVSLYGNWWHHPQKMALAPNGDLILSNIYRGTLWRMRPDGGLPEEGWTSLYHRGRNEPFESAFWTQEWWHCFDLKNYLPFHALHYPYFCFGPNGTLYISAGQSSHPTRRYAYVYEVSERDARYHWPEEGERGSHVWKCRLKPGPKAEKEGVISGFAEPSGLVVDGKHLIVADAGHNRLQVCTVDGKQVASITHYSDGGKKKPVFGPTALAMDRDGSLYVLIGSENRRKDARSERSLNSMLRPFVNAAAKAPPEPPRRVIKLRSWKKPQLLAVSKPLHPHTLQIAVDSGVKPALVWVANGAGPGNLQQLSGDDLSLKAQWQDSGEALSNPRQSGDLPILNIDPETGHVYVEDDSNHRMKQYGTVYRLDQQGRVLKKWKPLFFDARKLNILSPWGNIDHKRHFRYPNEPLFIDSIFGKDGKVYRWKLDKAGVSILRFDRSGKPEPFKATGTNALFVEPPVKFTHWWDVYYGMDIDGQGNLYYVTKLDRNGVSDDAYKAMHRQIDVYDASGKLKKKALLRLDCVRGIQVDKKGNLYIVHRPAKSPWTTYLALSKFSPAGGKPLWSRRWEGNPGIAQLANPPCHCTTSRFHQTLDGKGYIYTAGKYSVQVIDGQTGKLVGEFGSYGNRDCRGKGSRFPHPELPFGAISGLSVWRDRLFVVDEVNRRIVKCRIVYDPSKRKTRVDRELFPSHFGTGTEDYFGYAWGTAARFDAPFHAQPIGGANKGPGHTTNTRTRMLDRIPFQKSLKMNMELMHWKSGGIVDYATTTYWYARDGAGGNGQTSPARVRRKVGKISKE